MQDLIELPQMKPSGNLVVRSLSWDIKLRFRACALQGFFDGAFTLRQFLTLALPRMHRTPALMGEYLRYVNEVLGKFLLNGGDSLSLYGYPFSVYSQNYAEAIEFLKQIIFSDQYYAKHFLKPDSVVIDAGANIGIFSIFAARLVSRGHVYAFEPVKEVYDLFCKNVAPYQNVSAFQAGLGEKRAERTIFRVGNVSGGNIFEDSIPAEARVSIMQKANGSETAEVMTIDELVVEKGIQKLDFIKIDTEGYEANILNGARHAIQTWKPIIAMSAYHRPEDKTALPALLQSIVPEYVCELHHECEEDFICYVP